MRTQDSESTRDDFFLLSGSCECVSPARGWAAAKHEFGGVFFPEAIYFPF